MIVPAVCMTCGAVFDSGIKLGKGIAGIRISGVRVGPCPNGHIGTVADGTYDSINGALYGSVQGPAADLLISQLEKIRRELEEGKAPDKSTINQLIESLPAVAGTPLRLLAERSPALALFFLLVIYLGLAAPVALVLVNICQNLIGSQEKESVTLTIDNTISTTINITNKVELAEVVAEPKEKVSSDKKVKRKRRSNHDHQTKMFRKKQERKRHQQIQVKE